MNATTTELNGSVRPALVEWPTVVLLVAVYLGFAAVSAFADAMSPWLAVPLLALLVTLHSSLQHEVLHGHPFRHRGLSEAAVSPAVGLFIPYERFRDTHLQHHRERFLTDPAEDPESNFVDPDRWDRMGPVAQGLLRFNRTLAGHMLVGPAISLAQLYRCDLRAMARGDRAVWRAWALHSLGLVPVVAWWHWAATMPVWAYLAAAYGGISLLKVRTFLEHRAHAESGARSVIIEGRGFWALLFLNNNLHAVHHAHPAIAWYRLPALYRADERAFLKRNRGYRYAGYGEIFRRYILGAKDPLAHPLMRAPSPAPQPPSGRMP